MFRSFFSRQLINRLKGRKPRSTERRHSLQREVQRHLRFEDLESRRVLATFSNGAPIAILDSVAPPTTAAPYPSVVNVGASASVSAAVVDVNATLTGFTHTFPDDVGVILVSPLGERVQLMADAGGTAPSPAATLIFDDEAPGLVPDNAVIPTGSYQPTTGTNNGGFSVPANYPAPAPNGPYGNLLSTFDNDNPVGNWSLYVIDDTNGAAGVIASWSLDLQLGGAVVINAGAGANDTFPDNFEVTRNGANLEVRLNATLIFNEPFAGIASLMINGSGDNDTLTVNGGSALEDPIPAGGIQFNGGEQAGDDDRLILAGYDLNTADGVVDVQVNHTGPEAGNVTLSGVGTVAFTQIEPLTLTGTAADLVIDLTGLAVVSPDIVLGDDTLARFPAPANVADDVNVSAIDASTFEFTQFTNPTNTLAIFLSNNGDTIAVEDMDDVFAPGGAFPDAPLTILGGTGVDTLNVRSSRQENGGSYNGAIGVGLFLAGGGQNDAINVSSDAPANTGNLDAMLSHVQVAADSGSDTLNISDDSAAAGNNAVMSVVPGAILLAGMSSGGFSYFTTGGSFGGGINIDGSNNATDTFDLQATMPGVPTNLRGLGGDDSFTLQNGVSLNGGTIDGGSNVDTINYANYTTAVAVNLGLDSAGLTGNLQGVQENPPNNSIADGVVAITNYDHINKTFDINVTVNNMNPADVVGFHIHRAPVGANGPIIIDLTPLGALVPAGSGFTYSAVGVNLNTSLLGGVANEAAFLGGLTYVNIHTTPNFPGGEIRAQVFSTANVNPGANGTATGTGGINNIENATGGSSNDSLIGNFAANILTGNAGNDILLGGPGGDTFTGGANNDVMIWSNGDGTDVMDGNADADLVYVNGSVGGADDLVVSPNGARVDFDRIAPGPFSLDIGTTENLIVNGIGGDDLFDVNNLAGVADLTTVNLNGLDGNDTFTVAPSPTVTVNAHGHLPQFPTLPGDTLIYDSVGNSQTTPSGPGNGTISQAGFSNVNFTNIELAQTIGGGLTDIVLDANADPAPGAQMNDGNPDTFDARLDITGTLLELRVNGALVYVGLAATVNTLTVQGSTDDDTFTMTETLGGLPNFVGANALGHTNAAFTSHTGSATNPSIHFEADGGQDLFRIDHTAAAGARNTIYTTDMNDANSGVMQVADNLGGVLTRVSFDGLFPVDLIGPGLFGGDLLVDASATPNVTTLDISDDTVPPALVQFGAAVPGANYINGDDVFEDVRFQGYSRLIVIGGPGTETISLIGLDMAAANPLRTVILDGDDTTNTDASTDFIQVQSVPASVPDFNVTLLGGGGDDVFMIDQITGFSGGTTANVQGEVFVSTNVAPTLGSALPLGLLEEGGADTLYVDDFDGAAGLNVLLASDATSAFIEGITGYAGLGPDVRYNFPISALNPAPNLIETINISTPNDFTDVVNIQATSAGSVYYIDTGFFGAADDTVNISSDAPANAGTLNDIDGEVNLSLGPNAGAGGGDTVNVSDFGDLVADVYTLNSVGGFTELSFNDGAALVDIRYDVINFNPAGVGALPFPAQGNLENFNLVGSNDLAANNTYNINATTATIANRVSDGDATVPGGGNLATFNILGDNLSANNTFQGFDGNDEFNLTINTHIGNNALFIAPIASVVIEGNDPAVDSNNRDRLTIQDNAGFSRNLNYDHLDTTGDMDIAANAVNQGLFGANGGGNLALNVRTMETIVFNSIGFGDDVVQVSGKTADDDMTVALLPNTAVSTSFGSALVFLNGNPYVDSPPDTLAANRPGLAGVTNATGPDLLINGITFTGLTLNGEAAGGGVGNRAIIQTASEAPVLSGGATDIFGFGPGILIPGFGVGNAYDVININQFVPNGVFVTNNAVGQLVITQVIPATFVNVTPPPVRPGLIVNAGDEVAPQANGIADNITALAHPLFNIQVNGNLPILALGPDGLPLGDQLNPIGPGSINIFSDKNGCPGACDPNVQVNFDDQPFGIRFSSIERLNLDATPAPFPGGPNGVVNLIGDNNDATVDQTDHFTLVGRDVDGNLGDAGFQEGLLTINGSNPILLNGVQFLNAYGFDLVGVDKTNPSISPKPDVPATPAGADDIDTLQVRPYADNTPRGWGIVVNFNEGVPNAGDPAPDGDPVDLLIYQTSLFGGPVSEGVVVQPTAVDAGQLISTNTATNTPIVVINYTANTDLRILDDDGFNSDNDTLTLRGTNTNLPAVSGQDTVVVDVNLAGDAANPWVTVSDTNNTLLYRVQTFAGFGRVKIETLDGNDQISVTPRAVVNALNPQIEIDVDAGRGNDLLRAITTTAVQRVTFRGGEGDDALFGGVAADRLEGDAGNDILVGGPGDDFAYGGSGSDTFVWNPGDADDQFEGDEGNDQLAFAGANGTDNYTVLADAGRVIFQRTQGNVAINMGGVESIVANSETTQLTGRSEVPPNTTTSGGFANFTYSATTGLFDLRVFVTGLGAAQILDSHIHVGIAGANGPVVVPIGGGAGYAAVGGGLERTLVGQALATITPPAGMTRFDVLMEILLGRAYFNVHSPAFPGGEIRGQVLVSGPTAGSGGADTMTVRDLTGTAMQTIVFDAGNEAEIRNGAALADTMTVEGLASADNITVARINDQDNDYVVSGLPYTIITRGSDGDIANALNRDLFVLNGNAGDDILKASVDTLTRITLNGNDGNDFLSADAILNGGAGDDTLVGGAGDDTYNGNDGDDTLVISDGNDIMSGGAGFDTILYQGTNATEVLSLSQAGTTITVTGVNAGSIDVAAADLERIRVAAGDGDNTSALDGLAIATFYVGGVGVDTVDGSTSTAVLDIRPGDGNDVITGGDAADVIYGGNGNDVLIGDGGADMIYGEDGNDRFGDPVAGDPAANDPGADLYFGGAGFDRFVWDPGDGADVINGGEDAADIFQFNGSANADAFTLQAGGTPTHFNALIGALVIDNHGVEDIIVNGLGGADTFTINDLFPTEVVSIALNLGADADADAVTVNGRALNDNLLISTPAAGSLAVRGLRYDININGAVVANDGLTVSGNDGDDTIKAVAGVEGVIAITLNGNAGNDFLSADAILNGGSGDDTLVGGAGADTYNGNDGDDILVISDGADIMSGGAGFDTILYQGSNASETLSLAQAAGIITVSTTNNGTVDVTAADLERIQILAGDGDNTSVLTGLTIPTFYVGGVGVDTVTGTGTLAALDIRAGDGNDVIIGGDSVDLIYGGNGNDVLIGGIGADTIYGEDGNDRFGDPAAGDPNANDPGADFYFGGAGFDRFVWDPGDGADVINGGEDAADIFQFNGSPNADAFTLQAGGTPTHFNALIGALVIDNHGVEDIIVNGLGGADTFTVNDLFPTEVVSIALNLGADADADAVTVNGRALNDNLLISTPAAGSIAIRGLRYDINMNGAVVANDGLTVNGNDGDDTIKAVAGVEGVIAITLNGDAGNDFLSADAILNGGTGDDVLVGGAGADTYNGNDGDDILVISDGADTMSGGNGFDTILYQGSNATETLSLAQAAATITVTGTNTGTINVAAADLERIQILAGDGDNTSVLAGLAIPTFYVGGVGIDTVTGTTSTAALDIRAGDGNDVIIGGDGVDLIYGGNGNDVLIGGIGADTIYGEDGNDRFGDPAAGDPNANDPGADFYFGGAGFDRFVWDPGDGADVINGGEDAADIFQFNGSANADVFTLQAGGTPTHFNALIGALVIDNHGVEDIIVNGLGGADTFTINDLFPTEVVSIALNLGADADIDSVTVNGRAEDDDVTISTPGAGAIAIRGLRYDINISGAVVANDGLTVNGNDGDDSIKAIAGVEGIIAITLNGNAGNDFLSADAIINGGTGDDVLIGGTGNDTINGGDGDDTIDGRGGVNTIDGGAGADTFLVSGTNAGETITLVNAAANLTIAGGISAGSNNFTTMERVRLLAGAGADVLSITTDVAGGLDYDVLGGDPIGAPGDSLTVVIGGANIAFNPGPENDEGNFAIGAGPNFTVVSFDEIESTSVTGNATVGQTATINATNADNDINIVGTGTDDYTISVDGGPAVQYTNIPNLRVDGLAGDDDFDVEVNALNLASFVLIGNHPAGGGGDTLSVVGVLAAADGAIWVPNAVNGGNLQVGALVLGVNPIDVQGFERVIYNGENENELLTVRGTVGDDVITHTPGATSDWGIVRVNNLLAIEYESLGTTAAAGVVIDGLANTVNGFDLVIAEGTAASDQLGAGPAATITMQNHVDIDTVNVERYRLLGLGGDDTFNISPIAGIQIRVEGDEPGASDVLNFNAAAAPIFLNLAPSTITQAGFGDVSFAGIETVNVDANTQNLNVTATANDDVVEVTPLGTDNGRLRANGVAPLVNFSETGTFTVDTLLGGQDRLIVHATEGDDTVAVTGTSVTVTDPVPVVREAVNYSAVELLEVRGLNGDDTFNVTAATGITFFIDGGNPVANSDVMNLTVPAAAFVTQGAESTAGTVVNALAAPTIEIDYVDLEALNINSAAAASALTVRGTDDRDTMEVQPVAGQLPNTGRVWTNDGTVVTFNTANSNFNALTVQGRFGDDVITVTPIAGVPVNVDAGSPTGLDLVQVNGTAGIDTINYTPTGLDSGTVQVNALGLVTLAGTEHLTINGQGGNDALTISSPAGNQQIYLEDDSSAIDTGSVRMHNSVALGGQEFLPMNFLHLGGTGTIVFVDAAGARVDELTISPYANNSSDNFNVSAAGIVDVDQLSSDVPNQQLLSISTGGVAFLNLHGLAGDDVFQVPGNHPYTGLYVDGGDPGASDVLFFTGTGATVTVDLQVQTITQTNPVSFTAIEVIELDAGGVAPIVNATDDDDDVTVTVFSATSGRIEHGPAIQKLGELQRDAFAPLINYTNTGVAAPVLINLGDGQDTLIVVGNALNQNWNVNVLTETVTIDDLPAVGNDGSLAWDFAESVQVYGLEGNDTFTVTMGAIPVFVDGGDPIGAIPGDAIFVIGANGFFAGPESDEGGFLTPAGGTVSYDHIENIGGVVPAAGCPFLIVGTNADDDITLIARDASTHAGADGVQDFTFSVNAAGDILLLNAPEVFVDSGAGDDDVVIRAPAPNDADWDVRVFVATGTPSSGAPNRGDRVVLETPGNDSVVYTPTGSDTATMLVDEDGDFAYTAASTDSLITIAPFIYICDFPVGPPVEFTHISSPGGAEIVEYDGEGGNDTFTIAGTANADAIVHVPGLGSDEGFFRANTLLAISYQNLGATGVIRVDGNGGVDNLIVDGRAHSDNFAVAANTSAVTVNNHLALTPVEIEALTLNGLEGDDAFTINSPNLANLTNITVNGGGPGNSDVLTLNGAAATAEAFTVTPATTRGNGTVTINAAINAYTGIEHIFLTGNAGDNDSLVVNDDNRDNVWNVSAGTVGDLVQIDGRESIDFSTFNTVRLVNLFGTDVFRVAPTHLQNFATSLTVEGDAALPLDDVLEMLGTPANDLVTSTATAISVNGVAITVGNVNFAEVRVLTFAGSDTIDLDLDLPGVDAIQKYVDAGAGNDTVDMTGTVDANIFGGLDDDFLIGSPDSDYIDGGPGNDTILGLGAIDTLVGGEGNDILVAGAGADNIFGNEGSDILVWNPGDGNDLMEGGDGRDKLQFVGGAGADDFTLSANGTRLRFDRQPANIVLDVGGVEEVDVDTSVTFAGRMSGAQENPPVVTAAVGVTDLVYDSDTNRFSLDVFLTGITQADLTMSHIHVGAVGVNGGIIFDLGAGAAWTPQAGGLRRTVTDAEFPVANIADLLAGNTYVNVHTVANGGGEIRGQLNVSSGAPALAGADDTIVNDLFTTDVEAVSVGLGVNNGGAADAGTDTVVVNGRSVADDILVSVDPGPTNFANFVNVAGLAYDVTISNAIVAAPNADRLTLNGNEGDDRIKVNAPVEATINITLNGNDGDDFLSADAIINGGAGDDFLEGGAGDDTLNGNAGEDTMIGNGGNDTYDGGTEFDTILIRGTSGNDRIDVNQTAAATLTYTVNGVTETDTLVLLAGVRTVERALVQAGDGDDIIRVQWIDSLGQSAVVDSLRMDVEGGDDSTRDRLAVVDNGVGDLTLYRKGESDSNGSMTVGPAEDEPLEAVFQGIEYAEPVVGTNGRIVVFKHDPYEFNNDRFLATHLGAEGAINVDPTIDPGADVPFGLPSDQDFYRFEAQATGTLDFQVFFEELPTLVSGRAGLPGDGNLDIRVLDANGTVIAGGGAFGDDDPTNQIDVNQDGDAFRENERIRIPVVQGQTYYLHVFAAGAAINTYNMTVLNEPAAVPFDLELDDQPVDPTYNCANAAAPSALNSDTGRSHFDNVTCDNTPTVVFRLDDGLFLNDLPGNNTTDTPPDQVIPIPFQAGPNPTAAGYAIAIFDEGSVAPAPGNAPNANVRVPLGFATQVEPGLYQFTTPVLNDGSHFLTARVMMIDPSTPTQTGFGARSQSLEIVVDRVAPPVFFGSPGDPDDGLVPDPGVIPQPPFFVDNKTNDQTPEFWGTAEADSIIRVYADLTPGNGVDNFDLLLAMTVALPEDGNNQFPNGQWRLSSNVDLNDPAFFPVDGLRRILVTAEDLAGNVNPGAGIVAQALEIFVDTQGPQVTGVFNFDAPAFDIFNPKPTLTPTPLVDRLAISVRDLPARVLQFQNPALNPIVAVSPGHYQLIGDYNGIIPIATIVFIQDPFQANQPATGTVILTFFEPLPDDRFTLILSDHLVDDVGNALDGESNVAQPLENPTFPSGDGQPGGDFVARFTVDSRPELATWGSGNVWVDTNGNFTFDPNNDEDYTNRDISYAFGFGSGVATGHAFTTDDIFAGNFSLLPGSVADGFDKLGAYGGVGFGVSGPFRWLIDVDNDGVPDVNQDDPLRVNGLPVAGNFDGNAVNGDEVGIFTGTAWLFDTDHDFRLNAGSAINSALRGYPIVGDFDGDGLDDLGAWTDDTFTFDFASNGFGNATPDATLAFGFIGVNERPLAADMDQDGIDDLGLWVPERTGTTPREGGEWNFLVSNDRAGLVRVPGTLATLAHAFKPLPFGKDFFAQYGDDFSIPLVGNFDPPVAGVGSEGGVVMHTNSHNSVDINDDGRVTPIDALIVINELNERIESNDQAIRSGRLFGRATAPNYVDANGDRFVTSNDALRVVNFLNAQSGNAEGEGESSYETVIESVEPSSARAASSAATQSSVLVLPNASASVSEELTWSTTVDSGSSLAKKDAQATDIALIDVVPVTGDDTVEVMDVEDELFEALGMEDEDADLLADHAIADLFG